MTPTPSVAPPASAAPTPASAELRDGASEVLDQLGLVLRHHPLAPVEITGHTDERGSTRFNEQLSRDRAEAVIVYLVTAFGGGERITFDGLGASDPVDDRSTVEAWARNRRLEVLLADVRGEWASEARPEHEAG